MKPVGWREDRKYPLDPEYSWWTTRNVWLGFQSDVPGLRGAWLRSSLSESARFERLRPKVQRRHFERVGRRRLQRFDARRR